MIRCPFCKGKPFIRHSASQTKTRGKVRVDCKNGCAQSPYMDTIKAATEWWDEKLKETTTKEHQEYKGE